ncbi:hypothetical protein [Vibrio tetraodonis]|uniref:hypothetical protein n=1 Tax=Vibrio tetraodonis TaxID=2231647 RepID=UPI000E0ABED7|nr:hypothetical protein [Vibrio tetraodonis]
MSQESNWWDGFMDGASELASDLADSGKSYFNSREAEANANRAANENATVSQQARIAEQNRQDREAARESQKQQMQIYLFVGVAVLVVLVLLFKK